MKTSLLLRQIALLVALCASGYALAFPSDLSKYKQRVEQNAIYVLGEKIIISYTIEYPDTTSLTDITVSLPGIDKIKGLKLIYGPSVTTQTNFSIINGKQTQSGKTIFQFVFNATESGHYDLPDFVVTDKTTGNVIDFPPIHASFTVANDGTSGLNEFAEYLMEEPKTFLHAIISHDKIKSGESTTLTLKLLSNEDVRALEYFSGVEADDCFIRSELIDTVSPGLVEYEGKKYKEYLIGKYVITPLKSGEITLEPISVKCTIGPSLTDLFSEPESDKSKTVTVTSNPIILRAEK